MDYDQILYQVEDGVGLVTLNRPQKLNAMTAQMGAELGVGIDLARWRAKEAKLLGFTTQHPDAREGTISFFERRAPNWSGSISREFPDWPD